VVGDEALRVGDEITGMVRVSPWWHLAYSLSIYAYRESESLAARVGFLPVEGHSVGL
jgi:hypothetical protein